MIIHNLLLIEINSSISDQIKITARYFRQQSVIECAVCGFCCGCSCICVVIIGSKQRWGPLAELLTKST